jgi:hydroxypyruvate reductase
MALALVDLVPVPVRGGLIVGPAASRSLPAGFTGHVGGHPAPDEGSVAAGFQALEIASALPHGERLVVLLSGGASALLAVPAAGVSLEDKRETTTRLLKAGADIHALNTVRRHLSRIKGGWLAAVVAGPALTLAISDVIDDDLSVIGSGPTVADPTTFGEALTLMDRFGPRTVFPAGAVAFLERGARGEIAETPKPGDARLAGSQARVIATRRDALESARAAAEALGYDVSVRDAAVVGEARAAAREHLVVAFGLARGLKRPACVLATGETTVHVRGAGHGGRNQEFALAAAPLLRNQGSRAVFASLGTDGIDGPTDAAGAVTDDTTLARGLALGLGDHESYLRENDAYAYLRAVGDLVATGPTGTNVGDIQILLIDENKT